MPEISSIPGFRPRTLARRLGLGEDCMLCAAASGDLVCQRCRQDLPVPEASCDRCALPLAAPGTCGRCLARPPAFDAAAAAFSYAFPVDRIVARFKYSADFAAGRWLGLRLAERVRGEARPDAIVVPPLSSARLRSRGFNQALELAKVVARALRVPLLRDGFRRRRETAPQSALDREERLRNLRDAFECDRDFRGLDLAIVDDVMTTGATAEALASVLRAAGAGRVRVWIAARTPDPRGPA